MAEERARAEEEEEEEEERAGAARPALRREDHVHAELASFRAKVDSALDVLRRAADIGRVGVAFSGGKDSLVALHLARLALGDPPAAFFDSGCELPETYAIVQREGATTITPRYSMLEMARYAGWWGYANPVDPGCPFDAKRIVIQEPAETFVVRERLRVIVHGVRAEESAARSKHTRSRGELYESADRTWTCMPLARWTTADVWAYLASRGVDYHSAYDDMARARVPRESWRIATLLGERGAGWGRHALLRRYAPEQWAAIAREFPLVSLTSL